MKNAIRIILLVLITAMLCLPFVELGSPEDSMHAMEQEAKEKGYVTQYFENTGKLIVIRAEADANGKPVVKAQMTFYYCESTDAAKDKLTELDKDAKDNEVLERSGAIVYHGNDAARGELIRPAFWNTVKSTVKVSGVSFLVYTVFLIAAVGYLLGRVTIKGVNLGTAGVFLVALLFGCLFYEDLVFQLPSYTTNALKIVENVGLILFVTSVGFIAGPKFFGNLKKNFKTYILLGVIIIASGALICGGCIAIAKATMKDIPGDQLVATMTGLFSGALTSTPAFSASKEAVGAGLESYVAVGNGIAYIFGVVGVVLFVQLIPKFMRADMNKERELLAAANGEKKTAVNEDGEPIEAEKPVEAPKKKLLDIDPFGIAAFALAAIIGAIVGSIKFGSFSLTTTGGCLLVSLIFGHFRKCGPVNMMPPTNTLKVFRELGLMLFLIGAGVAGGAKFVECFQPIYFLYGALMTLLPMVVGFFFAKYVLKMNLLNSLGSITGGMTSTPALGTLIQVSGTEDVGSAYAATYPISLISVVLCSQFLIMIFL
jgi:putative transport protein